jgi:hypothetical protein
MRHRRLHGGRAGGERYQTECQRNTLMGLCSVATGYVKRSEQSWSN